MPETTRPFAEDVLAGANTASRVYTLPPWLDADGITDTEAFSEDILAGKTHFQLSPEQWDAFTALLDAPVQPDPALIRLLPLRRGTSKMPIAAHRHLEESHNRKPFRCGESVLDAWLKIRFHKNETSGASRTYISTRDNAVMGYYSLAVGLDRRLCRAGCAQYDRSPFPSCC